MTRSYGRFSEQSKARSSGAAWPFVFQAAKQLRGFGVWSLAARSKVSVRN